MSLSELQFEHLSVQRGGRFLLKDLSLKLPAGSRCLLAGPNGAGKSTLLRCLLGLLPYHGGIQFAGRALPRITARERAGLMAWVPQADRQGSDFLVEDFVALARYAREPRFSSPATDHPAVCHALELTSCVEWRKRRMSTLSGGEKQRVMLAAALAQEAEWLLLDEPTAFLDPGQCVEFAEVLRRIHAERACSYLLVSHDLRAMSALCDTAIALKQGERVYFGQVQGLLQPQMLQELYGRLPEGFREGGPA